MMSFLGGIFLLLAAAACTKKDKSNVLLEKAETAIQEIPPGATP